MLWLAAAAPVVASVLLPEGEFTYGEFDLRRWRTTCPDREMATRCRARIRLHDTGGVSHNPIATTRRPASSHPRTQTARARVVLVKSSA